MAFIFCLVTIIEKKKAELARLRPQASTHMISWMVSNCGTHSERENFVEELQQFVDVDIYGGCGPLKVRTGLSGSNDDKTECFPGNAELCLEYSKTILKFFSSSTFLIWLKDGSTKAVVPKIAPFSSPTRYPNISTENVNRSTQGMRQRDSSGIQVCPM